MTFSIIINIIPPPESNHQSPSNIFDSPKIHGEKQDYNNKTSDETVREPCAEHIDDYR